MRAALSLVPILALACSNDAMHRRKQLPAPQLASVRIDGVPHVEQRPDFCGEACVAMWLGKLGKPGDQDWVFDRSDVSPLLGRGAYSRELARGLAAIGFDAGPGWYHVDAGSDAQLAARFAELHADLVRGVPSIVCMHYRDGEGATEHFRLILGYDAERDEVLYHEPAEASGAYRRMDRAQFLRLWPLPYERDRWTVIRFRLEPVAVAGEEPAAPTTHTPADFAQHMMELRKRVPDGFVVELAPPFVVIGDSSRDAVRSWASDTVLWAVEKLKAEYFTEDPQHIIEIWLFKDAKSYRKHTKELFGDDPSTPYGYYSPEHKALIMNIATGGGTLVHEIVHPYVEANFPDAPPWLNEGLGSLYEQSSERKGRIVGLTNWRLAGLKEAIGERRLPTFQALTAMDATKFYDGQDTYAQSRYLLYYLQEQGVLRDYYRKFYAARAQDPTGYRTLKEVLGVKDMAAFQEEWEDWVLGLVF